MEHAMQMNSTRDNNRTPSFHMLGELLLREGAISNSQLRAALTMQTVLGGRLGEILISHNCITVETLDYCLELQARHREGAVRDSGCNGGLS